MIIKLIKVAMLSLVLTACAHKKLIPPRYEPSDDASIKLAEAASSISDSILEVARIEKTIAPQPVDNSLTIPSHRNLQTRASVDWSGPVEELTAKIARAAHFRFRVLGQEPTIPVLVSVNSKDQSLAEILRNIDYQAGQKAFIHVYPNSQIVELRYAKFYS